MSTLSQSAVPLDSAPGVRDAPSAEEYGGENLPVLIRLPDLSVSAERAQPAADATLVSDAAGEMPASESSIGEFAADEPSTLRPAIIEPEMVEMATVQPVAEESATEPRPGRPLRQRRQLRRERVVRRNERQAAMPGWLRGIVQLVVATVLAGVLLAIVVTLKNWNTNDGLDPQHHDGVPFVEAPPLDFGDPTAGLAAEVEGLQGPDLGPPTFTEQGPMLESALPAGLPAAAFDSRGAIAPAAAFGERTRPADSVPAAFRGRRHTAAAPQYPTTGIESAVAVPESPARNGVRGWSETLPGGRVRNAERPPLPYNNQHR